MAPGPDSADHPADGEVVSEAALREQVESGQWYHTLELRPGIETPGWFDTRTVAGQLPWPVLDGLRCLDVGTFEGFWAFEMERRGAAEVVAVDILDPAEWDWPAGSSTELHAALAARKRGGDGFLVAARERGSAVVRREMSVYDLDAEVVGTFDFVYLGSLLLHLRDPVRALERVRAVCRADGRLMVVDAVDLELTVMHPRRPVATLDGLGRPWWWKANLAGLARMVTAAGFDVQRGPQRVFMPPGRGQPVRRPRPKALLTRGGREQAITARRGDPHAWLLAAPRPLPLP